MSIENFKATYSICAGLSGESEYLVQIFLHVHVFYAKVNLIKSSRRAQYTKLFN